jgi:predicted RNase H-like HicB family nuclease
MPDTPRTMTAALHREEDWYIAQCPEVDVASQGHTIDEALANLGDAVELYLEEVHDPAGHVTAPRS